MTADLQVRSPDSGAATGEFVRRVPVRNLWLLMLYASELFRTQGSKQVAVEENPDELPDMVAELLARVVEQRQRMQLTTGYQSRRARLHRIRGRIDVLSTERHQLMARGQVACIFEHQTINTPRNRFVRAALEHIAGMVRQADLAHRCRSLAKRWALAGVGGIAPSRAEMSTERFGRNDARDQLMVSAAQLALDLALPTEFAGPKALPLPGREGTWVRQLFERAIGGFYDVVLSPAGWRVSRGMWLEWQIESRSAGIDRILPSMRTDIVLEHSETGRRLVIDTKFTSILTNGWYREESLRSGYVYQMYAYLRSQAGSQDPVADRACGLLLHPSIGSDIDETVVIQGHAIRFATVDLAAPAATIRSHLLGLVLGESHPGRNIDG